MTEQSWPSICHGRIVEGSTLTWCWNPGWPVFCSVLLVCDLNTALFQPIGGLHYDPVFELCLPDVLLNATGQLLNTCLDSANGRPQLWSSVWVLQGPFSWWTLLVYSELAALFQPMGGLQGSSVWVLVSWCPAKRYWMLLFLTTCFVSANGRGLHLDPSLEFWLPGPLLNAIGLFLTTCLVSANWRPPLWPCIWVLSARCPAECYWSVTNYLPCFSQWEASTVTQRLSSGSPVPWRTLLVCS